MKPIFDWIRLSAIMLVAVAATFAHAESNAVPEYKIGAILPLSGPMAFAGSEVRDAINLGLSNSVASRFKFSVVFEDNGAGAKATAAATQKLIDQDKVNAIITLWPEAANVAAPITEQRKVLHYTIAWDPEIACSRKLVLSHQAAVADYARATLGLLQSKGATNVVFFHDTVFQEGAQILSKLAPESGITIAKTNTFDRGKIDFRSELAASRERAAGGILIWSIMPETEIFLRQVRELKIKSFVTGFFDVVQNLALIEGMPFASEVYGTAAFEKKFSDRFGHPTAMKGPNAYDIIQLLIHAVERAPGNVPDAAAVKSELLKVKAYAGAVGTVSIDSCGNSSYPVVIKEAHGGKLSIQPVARSN